MEHVADNEWDLVIQPKSLFFNLNIKEIWNFRDLLFLLVRRDFVSFYKQTILGPLWFFIQPLFTTIIYVFIFGNLAGLSTNGIPQPLFYMTGVVFWNYFADCLVKTSTVFKDNAHIFGKVYFPRMIMPLSIVVSNLVRFSVQLLLLLFTLLYFIYFKNYHIHINYYFLFFPIIIALMALLGLGAGLLISAMTTKYRDLVFLITFGVQLLMYATPIIYPLNAAPLKFKKIIEFNPISPLMELTRLGLFGKGEFNIYFFFYTLFFSVFVLIGGILIFNNVEKTFIDTV